MMEDKDWSEEIAHYDMDTASEECRAMWLRMGRHFKSVAESFEDFFESAEKDGTEALHWTAIAEACFWRAAGEEEPFNVEFFFESSIEPEV